MPDSDQQRLGHSLVTHWVTRSLTALPYLSPSLAGDVWRHQVQQLPFFPRPRDAAVDVKLAAAAGSYQLTTDCLNLSTKNHSESATSAGRHLECRWKSYFMENYSWQPNIGRIAQFGGDVLNHGRDVTIWKVSTRRFWPWTLTFTSHKLNSEMWRRCWTSLPNFMKPDLNLSRNDNERNEATTRLTWSQYRAQVSCMQIKYELEWFNCLLPLQ